MTHPAAAATRAAARLSRKETPMQNPSIRRSNTVCGVTFALIEGIVYPLTPCCKASAKGTANYSSGASCRACHREIPAIYGSGELAQDEGAVVRMIARVVAELGNCPDPQGCAQHTLWRLSAPLGVALPHPLALSR